MDVPGSSSYITTLQEIVLVDEAPSHSSNRVAGRSRR